MQVAIIFLFRKLCKLVKLFINVLTLFCSAIAIKLGYSNDDTFTCFHCLPSYQGTKLLLSVDVWFLQPYCEHNLCDPNRKQKYRTQKRPFKWCIHFTSLLQRAISHHIFITSFPGPFPSICTTSNNKQVGHGNKDQVQKDRRTFSTYLKL